MPVLGELNVIGFTLDEIRVKIEKQLLADYFKKKPIFFVIKISGL
jgi:polysaccharide export outer membrane protein